jgi:hypothetical protein
MCNCSNFLFKNKTDNLIYFSGLTTAFTAGLENLNTSFLAIIAGVFALAVTSVTLLGIDVLSR